MSQDDSTFDDLAHWGYKLIKKFFLLTWQINVLLMAWVKIKNWVINGLTEKRYCKKQKENIAKKKLLSII